MLRVEGVDHGTQEKQSLLKLILDRLKLRSFISVQAGNSPSLARPYADSTGGQRWEAGIAVSTIEINIIFDFPIDGDEGAN